MWGKEFKHRYFIRGWGTREEKAGSKVCVLKQVTPTSRVSYHPGGELISLWGTYSEACLPERGDQGIYTPTPSSHWLREAGGYQQGLMGVWAPEARKAHSKHDVSWHWTRPTYNDMVRPERRGWAPGVSGRWGRGGWGKSTPRDPGMPMLEASSINSYSWGGQEKQMQTDTRFTEQSVICMPTTVINCWLSELKYYT